jgi:hypothetical protein
VNRGGGWATIALVAVGVWAPAAVLAHGTAVAPPPSASEPRFAATSHTVEITGILKGGVLWCYADHYASNAPWPGLKLELQIGARDAVATEIGEGVYRLDGVHLTDAPQPVIVTVSGPDVSDLVTGMLPAAKRRP